MSTEELKILFDYLKLWSSKFQLVIAICAFRGLRISECIAINILDFNDNNFDRLTYREAKTNKMQHNRPIIKPLAEMIKAYVVTNRHMMKDGYLFPYYNSRKKAPHMTAAVAEAQFSKIRKKIGKDYPQFLDKYDIKVEKGIIVPRYRIGFHSLRRWFETHLHDCTGSSYIVKEVMDYSKYEPLNAYLNRNRVMDQEPELLEKSFGPVLGQFNNSPAVLPYQEQDGKRKSSDQCSEG